MYKSCYVLKKQGSQSKSMIIITRASNHVYRNTVTHFLSVYTDKNSVLFACPKFNKLFVSYFSMFCAVLTYTSKWKRFLMKSKSCRNVCLVMKKSTTYTNSQLFLGAISACHTMNGYKPS